MMICESKIIEMRGLKIVIEVYCEFRWTVYLAGNQIKYWADLHIKCIVAGAGQLLY